MPAPVPDIDRWSRANLRRRDSYQPPEGIPKGWREWIEAQLQETRR